MFSERTWKLTQDVTLDTTLAPLQRETRRQLTDHLVQQLAVAFSKEHTQIQDFGNVKQEVLIDDFSKHGRGEEVFLTDETCTSFTVTIP